MTATKMSFFRPPSLALAVIVLFASAQSVLCQRARAQDAEAPAPESGSASDGSASSSSGAAAAPELVTSQWAGGAPAELWTAAGLSLGIGVLTLAVGAAMWSLASDQHTMSLDPSVTQRQALGFANTANDYGLVANILFVAGASIAAIGVIWCVVLPFAWHPVPQASVALAPTGLVVSGVF